MNHQKDRRSGSLPPMSRLSLAGGCQRVPIAPSAEQRRNSGMGSSLKRCGSTSALSSVSKQSRVSHIGTSSSATTLKDPRPLSDKLYRERLVQQLVAFLSSHSYPNAIGLKGSNGPSSGDFKKIFEFMVCHLIPDYKLTGKLEEEVPRLLKTLKYPVTITNSHMRTIGVPSTWVVLLGALSFLRMNIEDIEAVDIDAIRFCGHDDESLKSQNFHEYVDHCYQHFLAGNDDEIEKIRSHFFAHDTGSVTDSQVTELEAEVKHHEEVLMAMQSTPNEVTLLTEETRLLEADMAKMDVYIVSLEKYQTDLGNQLCASKKNLELKVAEKTALELEIEKKRKVLSEQQLSGRDAQRLNTEIKARKVKVALAEKGLAEIKKQLENSEQQYQLEQDAVNIAVDEFNNKARRLRLIPPSAEFAEGVDMEMNASLSAEESNRYEIIIRPALHMISRHQMEKLRDAEEKLREINDTLVHFDDVLANHKEELTSLMGTVSAVDLAAELCKQNHQQECSVLQQTYEDFNKAVMNRAKPAITEAKERLDRNREILEQEKKTQALELRQACKESIELTHRLVEHKENVKKMLKRIADQMENSDLEREIKSDLKEVRDKLGGGH